MSSTDELDSRMIELMATVFDIESDQINADSSVDNLDRWDSVNHMHLVIALEEEFDIEFQDNDAVELISYELIRSHLQEKLAK